MTTYRETAIDSKRFQMLNALLAQTRRGKLVWQSVVKESPVGFETTVGDNLVLLGDSDEGTLQFTLVSFPVTIVDSFSAKDFADMPHVRVAMQQLWQEVARPVLEARASSALDGVLDILEDLAEKP